MTISITYLTDSIGNFAQHDNIDDMFNTTISTICLIDSIGNFAQHDNIDDMFNT
ncbi:hypothetical protein IJT93_12055 [bacterium]|nr:hypothetical protein [bacterium]